jgi:hypothetical protein
MRIAMGALGQSNCGTNPCTWLDELWASDTCKAYMQCADPTSVIATGSFVTSALAQTGAALGQGVAQGTSGFFSSQSPLSMTVLAVVGIAVVGVVLMAVKR